MLKKCIVSMVAVVGAAGVYVPQAVAENVAATGKECAITVESGTVKWGIKQSWRSYILGNIAHGTWKTSGHVKDNNREKSGNDFQFSFDVDPAKTKITVKDGKVISSEIRTQDSSIVFTGHNDALHSEFKSPIISTSGSTLNAGSGYAVYYIPGKAMGQYTKDDHTEKNKKTGEGYFAQGQVSEWKTSGEDGAKLTLKGSNLQYTPQRGTDGHKGTIEGVDLLFMGQYDANYKPSVDDVEVELQVKNTCGAIDGTADPDTSPFGGLPKIWGIILSVLGGLAALGGVFHLIMNSGLL
ncbi:HtaA domain-containing protein [Corynebacterium diphtheriae]|uniref:HtaA domain-containing protein n=1 Tax=Corynebacterium diphtheriae TaxID=1717 RepID=UPI0013C7D45F|nr:hemin transporter associated protein [Corynebacterium diphtheriae]